MTTAQERQRSANARNANATPEATFAMFAWPRDYAAQNSGSMDYFDSLSDHRKDFCRRAVDGILQAAERHRQAHVKTKRT